MVISNQIFSILVFSVGLVLCCKLMVMANLLHWNVVSYVEW